MMTPELISTIVFGIIAYIVAFAVFLNKLNTSIAVLTVLINSHKENFDGAISRLETKQDKHNCLIERMAIVESSTKSAHHRLDELKEKE